MRTGDLDVFSNTISSKCVLDNGVNTRYYNFSLLRPAGWKVDSTWIIFLDWWDLASFKYDSLFFISKGWDDLEVEWFGESICFRYAMSEFLFVSDVLHQISHIAKLHHFLHFWSLFCIYVNISIHKGGLLLQILLTYKCFLFVFTAFRKNQQWFWRLRLRCYQESAPLSCKWDAGGGFLR